MSSHAQGPNMSETQTALLRLPQIIGSKKHGIQPMIPVSRSTWFDGVKAGRFPQPIKLSERVTAWRADEIYALTQKK
jgi:prophage regulatory protein